MGAFSNLQPASQMTMTGMLKDGSCCSIDRETMEKVLGPNRLCRRSKDMLQLVRHDRNVARREPCFFDAASQHSRHFCRLLQVDVRATKNKCVSAEHVVFWLFSVVFLQKQKLTLQVSLKKIFPAPLQFSGFCVFSVPPFHCFYPVIVIPM
jgi:hypothetical protein